MAYQYPILIALVMQRLWEVYISRQRLAKDMEQGGAELIDDPALPAMVALHTAWIAGCWLEVVVTQPNYQGMIVIPALIIWGMALALRIWLLDAMGSLWSIKLIKRKKQKVVTSGPYRFIRHPNYVAVILEITFVPLVLGAYWTALLATVANGVVLWYRIRSEEAYLDSVRAYRKAFEGKKRFIPWVF